MNLEKRIEEGISNWLLATIVILCASPAITLNVWPRVSMLVESQFLLASGNHGTVSNQIGIVLLVTMSALGMAAVPFAMKKAENYGFWSTCLAFGIGLGVLNYTMAVGAIGKSRDEEAGQKTSLIERARSLKASIAETETSRRNLPPFKWTSQDMVASASSAIALAREARDQECGKVGDICRARVAQLSNRQAEAAIISQDRAITERAEYLDNRVSTIRNELAGLGPIPDSNDPQAGRIAGLLYKLGIQSNVEGVATGLIHLLAFCAEAFALGMPRIIVTALAKGPREGKNHEPLPNPIPKYIPPTRTTNNKQPPAKPAGANEAPIGDWKQNFLIRSTGRIRSWEAFEHYSRWAKEGKLKPSTFPTFESELERLGVKKETDLILKRDFLLEVAIKQPLKAVS